ncbi:bifunctional DNA primase/polymerase [Streptomyces sp. JJ66]|uniref:bifunctional DNA primase/polymerase n=1 Tax=Streptomyces sp. JJ66 TaxID=2803843 RepID=UPI001C5829DF|nr:bifunctional DNA primase/polymerase [Streptomyces sp. JJ66]MBW1603989.1 bifunctional DNA primase/polymerase [Streptomyces sp. JJ66]
MPGRATPRGPAPHGDTLLDHALRYTSERHWDVLPGSWLEIVTGVPRCVCREADCPSPGAHPLQPGWSERATGGATAARRLWERTPFASVLLPTGRTFDAIDVPEVAGCLALARMERLEVALGPVTSTPQGRMLFLVLPGAASKAPGLIRRLGWSPGALDLATHGEGSWIAAPPTRVGVRGCVQWVRHPTDANRWLPDAEELLPHLAYACGQEAATARTRST